MLRIEFLNWAKVRIAGKVFWQVLIVENEVVEREVERVKREYGEDHLIADWEEKLLLSKNPEVIVIANGWSGLLKVSEKFKNQVVKLGIELKVLRTPGAVEEYNRLVAQGRRVNALIHTTC